MLSGEGWGSAETRVTRAICSIPRFPGEGKKKASLERQFPSELQRFSHLLQVHVEMVQVLSSCQCLREIPFIPNLVTNKITKLLNCPITKFL